MQQRGGWVRTDHVNIRMFLVWPAVQNMFAQVCDGEGRCAVRLFGCSAAFGGEPCLA